MGGSGDIARQIVEVFVKLWDATKMNKSRSGRARFD